VYRKVDLASLLLSCEILSKEFQDNRLAVEDKKIPSATDFEETYGRRDCSFCVDEIKLYCGPPV